MATVGPFERRSGGVDPGIGEIGIFASGRAPAGWVPCDGRELPIAEHQPLFSILGWRAGGDGVGTFAVPALPPPVPGSLTCIAVRGRYPRRIPEVEP